VARRDDRLRAGAPLVLLLAADADPLFDEVLRFFFRTAPLVATREVEALFFFLFAFTFAKRLSPRKKTS
tara:strand:+ start:42 stop:248 length:207 start_codon:yes stop_codon:yes gene_type:complete